MAVRRIGGPHLRHENVCPVWAYAYPYLCFGQTTSSLLSSKRKIYQTNQVLRARQVECYPTKAVPGVLQVSAAEQALLQGMQSCRSFLSVSLPAAWAVLFSAFDRGTSGTSQKCQKFGSSPSRPSWVCARCPCALCLPRSSKQDLWNACRKLTTEKKRHTSQ